MWLLSKHFKRLTECTYTPNENTIVTMYINTAVTFPSFVLQQLPTGIKKNNTNTKEQLWQE